MSELTERIDDLRKDHMEGLIDQEAYKASVLWLIDEDLAKIAASKSPASPLAAPTDSPPPPEPEPTFEVEVEPASAVKESLIETMADEPVSPPAAEPEPEPLNLDLTDVPAALFEKITEQLTPTDIQTIAFFMDINFDGLSGRSLNERVLSMIQLCQKDGRLPELIGWCQSQNGAVDWAI